ncbi:MAG: tripartite tricarboxylate transporter substrate binding protein [Alcaligenaceae bacterium]
MTTLIKRLAQGLLALSPILCSPSALAQNATDTLTNTYPAKAVRIIVPYTAGGSTDILARTLGQHIGETLHQSVIIENKPGAGSNIGATYVARANPDGYTLLLGTSTALSANISLYKNLAFNPEKDFAPVILATMLPSVLLVPPSLNVRTVQELTAYLKKAAPPASYASSGSGTPSHLGVELYKRIMSLDVTHIPYKGGAPALLDLIGGQQTTFMLAILPDAAQMIQNGQLRPLAVTTAKRLAAQPAWPTMAESGVDNFELIGWFAIVAPANTPPAIIGKLNQAFNRALQDQTVQGKLKNLGFEIEGGSPEKLGDLIRTETIKWKKVIDDANVTPD